MHILLLTEDTGQKSFDVVQGIVKKILHLLSEGSAIELVRFEPGDERARRGMGFNGFKSTSKHEYDKRVDLARAIVTQLLRVDMPRFVVVHVDGDRRWSERGEACGVCENHAIFERHVVRRVRDSLEQRGQIALIERLLYTIPFYSIEAWLYQNSAELQKIVLENPRGHERVAALLKAWRDEPGCLDEVEQPKRQAATIQDNYNIRLMKTFPGRKVYDLGQSFAYCVDAFERCGPLFAALQAIKYVPR